MRHVAQQLQALARRFAVAERQLVRLETLSEWTAAQEREVTRLRGLRRQVAREIINALSGEV